MFDIKHRLEKIVNKTIGKEDGEEHDSISGIQSTTENSEKPQFETDLEKLYHEAARIKQEDDFKKNELSDANIITDFVELENTDRALQSEKNTTTTELTNIKSELDVKRSELSKLQSEKNTTTTELTNIKSELDVKRSELSKLQSEKNDAEGHKNVLLDEIKCMEQEIESNKSKLVKLKTKGISVDVPFDVQFEEKKFREVYETNDYYSNVNFYELYSQLIKKYPDDDEYKKRLYLLHDVLKKHLEKEQQNQKQKNS